MFKKPGIKVPRGKNKILSRRKRLAQHRLLLKWSKSLQGRRALLIALKQKNDDAK
jgi:hypothetical protein